MQKKPRVTACVLTPLRSWRYPVFLRVPLGILWKLLVDDGIDFRSPEPYEGGDVITELIEGKSVAFFTEISSQTRCKQNSNCGRKGFECQSQERNEREDELVSRAPSKPDQDDNSKLDVDSKCQPDATKHRLDNLVSNVGMASVQVASDPKYLGSTFEISFARVVFSAVGNSFSTSSTERGGLRSAERQTGGTLARPDSSSSMCDSIFGLQERPIMKPKLFQAKWSQNSL
ncbi:conserved hypothetical protein [Histoplasma capsulatum G186AR]|uniref:Uncharacterized protein n=1 Tax=Ajellomyces capsulatus (strain G186AR / H82 / ATCC MYA-2454 / RMSCC 2432) TaxID=447093 RepID=C0NL15_AJECG|nr:uncharacterized protein HCBG_03845 [Histoplasma capsulatum G186AR]EEH08556.1 conserved hypothetical protein [Histoplasma capsulatum G186AR]